MVGIAKKRIWGIDISNVSKEEFLEEVARLVKIKKRSYVVTPYSEFFSFAKKDPEFQRIINNADVSIADGIGIAVALKYMKMKGVIWPLVRCAHAVLFNRSWFKDEIKEKISGSRVIYDLAELSEKKKWRVFFLGGFDFGKGNTAELTAKKLKEKYPNLIIAGVDMGSGDVNNATIEEEEALVKRINATNPDLLFIAYGPRSQEKWVDRNINKLHPVVSFCIGGTFDYVSGAKKQVPIWLSDRGFEGVLRPFYSEGGNPKRIYKRMVERSWLGLYRFFVMMVREKKKIQ